MRDASGLRRCEAHEIINCGQCPQPDRLWEEFLSDRDLCGLCGQSGIIDTTGMRSPAGVECGVVRWCICPNGRAFKEQCGERPGDTHRQTTAGDLRPGDRFRIEGSPDVLVRSDKPTTRQGLVRCLRYGRGVNLNVRFKVTLVSEDAV